MNESVDEAKKQDKLLNSIISLLILGIGEEKYPRDRALSKTFFAVFLLAGLAVSLFSTLETVEMDTPDASAISFSFIYIIAVAGMEGALPSVVGGLVDCPVIAVPTSVGYGANLKGMTTLLAMLNSCASGLSVVNIDNGFGAGYLASMINQMEGIK